MNKYIDFYYIFYQMCTCSKDMYKHRYDAVYTVFPVSELVWRDIFYANKICMPKILSWLGICIFNIVVKFKHESTLYIRAAVNR